jgi:hypothetical protein
MIITTKRVKDLGFKRHYNDYTYRIRVGDPFLCQPKYLTICRSGKIWVWWFNSMEQMPGMSKMTQLKGLISAVDPTRQRLIKRGQLPSKAV